MFRIRTKFLFPWLLFFTALSPIAIHAQEEFRYIGPLKVGDYQGEADYGYTIVDGDTLLDGDFQMELSNLESLLDKKDYSFLFKGGFANDYPIGLWNFQFGEYESTSQSEVVDYQYRVLVSGNQEEAAGNIQRGKPDGTWTYTVNQIKDSEVEKLLFKSTITFENGIPQRSFRIENDSSTLVGRFLRNGLAHDEWSLFSTNGIDAEENWTFNNGLLQKIERNSDGSLHTISVFGTTAAQTTTIGLDNQYINALKLHLDAHTTAVAFPQGIENMIAQNAAYYQKIDGILSELGKSDFAPKFRVKVPYFPLDSLETVRLDSIKGLFAESEKISSDFLDNTQLNILKLSDQEAFFQYELIRELSENYLDPTRQMLNYEQEGIFEFIARDKMIEQLWPEGMPSKTIEVATDSLGTLRVFALPNAADFDFGQANLATVKRLVEYAHTSIKSIQKVLDDKLTKEQRQQDLIQLEEKLILQNKALHQLIDSANTNATAVAKKALSHIKQSADDRLASYSGMQDVTAKLEYAKALVECYAGQLALTETIAALPAKWQTIQENYQDRVWNPFMATLMDEEVKKRITGAYQKVLIPYFLGQVTDNDSCENTDELVENIKSSYQRVLQLRGEETSKLERKLRKEQDPQVVLQLFNLQAEDQN